MPLIYGDKRLRKRTVHGGNIGETLTELLTGSGKQILKGLPKHALKLLGPILLRLITPVIFHGIDKVTEARNQFLSDKPDIVKNLAITSTDNVIEAATDKLLKLATKEKKAKGLKKPIEMQRMLNKRSELILNNLLH